MLFKVHKSTNSDEQGVVSKIVIGIIALVVAAGVIIGGFAAFAVTVGIAAPAIVNKDKSAIDTSTREDIITTVNAIESNIANVDDSDISIRETGNEGTYTLVVGGKEASVTVSEGTVITVSGNINDYIIQGTNKGGDTAKGEPEEYPTLDSEGYIYSSANGGMM